MRTRIPAIIIGLFLVAVWIAGLWMHARPWLSWLNGVGAVLAFVVAGMARRGESAANIRSTTVVLSLGLFALWIVALIVHSQTWIVWCTFGAACASAILAVSNTQARVVRHV